MKRLRTSLFRKLLTNNTNSCNKRQQVIFFRELGALIQSGYTLTYSINILMATHQEWRVWLIDINHDLKHGIGFHDSMQQFVSPSIFLQLKLAYQHGRLSETLLAIGNNLEQMQRQQDKIMQVLRYPLVLLALLGVLLVGIKYLLYPILDQWQGNMTRVNYVMTAPLVSVLMMLIMGIVCVILLWQRWSVAQRLNFLVKLPIVGRILKTIITYQIAQQLAVLLSTGLTLPEILETLDSILMKTEMSKVMAYVLTDARMSLKKGYRIEDYVISRNYFNASLSGYFSKGHDAIVTADYLAHYAKLQFEQLMLQTDRLIGTIQPICFGMIGLGIIAVYISMLLPMYHTIGNLYQ